MTKLLDKALEAVRTLSPAEQDEIARAMLALANQADEDDGEDIDPADLEAIDRGLDDMKNGRFATDEQVEAAFRSFRK
jgi:predicted transcriptional regulator